MRTKLVTICIVIGLCAFLSQCSSKVSPVEEFSDPKLFKQLLRTRTNVMVLFYQSKSATSPILKAYKDAASEVRGIGTMVMVDCSGAGQKLCRQMKAVPEPYVLQHFKDGKFHKVYDRQETTKSLVRFMNDPTGDIPWDEEPSGKSVVHLDNPSALNKLLKKHKSVLVMFYAPWCVYCKQMKPDFAAAAAKVRASAGVGILAAMDVVRTENAAMRTKYNITGFPTLLYFKNGELQFTYEGENKESSLVEFMKNPTAAPAKPKEIPWSEEKSEVHHLTAENFDPFLEENPSVLVMFYAPWCGHCKKLKPGWMKAATIGKGSKLDCVLAAVDATKETALAERFKVKGFPTIKYFKDGKFLFDTPDLRDVGKIVEFMQDPKEPPPPPPPEPDWSSVPSEVVHLTSDNFKSQLRAKRHALVMFYAPWCGHCKNAKPEFEKAAELLKEEPRMVLAAVNCNDHAPLCNYYKVKGYPTFLYFKYLKEQSHYDGGRKAKDFVSYLVNLEHDSSVKVDGIEEKTPPPISPDPGSGIPTEDYERVFEAVKKKQEMPPDYPGWDELIHLTDENYKKVTETHKHLFIMFHAKWCNFCRSVKPIFAKLALDADLSGVKLAACNTDLAPNLVDEFLIESLPFFKYVQEGKPVTTYTGERTELAFKDFIRNMKNTKDEL